MTTWHTDTDVSYIVERNLWLYGVSIEFVHCSRGNIFELTVQRETLFQYNQYGLGQYDKKESPPGLLLGLFFPEQTR